MSEDAFVTEEVPVLSLRELIKQRAERKARRVHKQWFCFDPVAVSARREAEAEFIAVYAGEFVQAPAQQQQANRKSAWSPKSQELSERVNALKAAERKVGATAVFHNLTSDEIDACTEAAREAGGKDVDLGRAILLAAFMYWEGPDDLPIDLSELGKDDLDAYLDPKITEEGDWKPLANLILAESKNPIDRPTSPQL